MPGFMILFGLLTGSELFKLTKLNEYCQFLNDGAGRAVFYIYLAALMAIQGESFNSRETTIEYTLYIASIFYLVMAILNILFKCMGKDKVQAGANNLTQKLTSKD